MDMGIDEAENLVRLNFQIIVILYRIMEHIGLDMEQLLGSEIKLYNQLNQCSSMTSVMLFFSNLLDSCINIILSSQKSCNKKLIGKAMEYIVNHYDQNISLNTVADHTNISTSYLSRMFKEEYNETFIDFIIKYRINKALIYFKEGSYTVNEVSKMVGFNDDKYFHRAFKKITGFTPGNYKKRN